MFVFLETLRLLSEFCGHQPTAAQEFKEMLAFYLNVEKKQKKRIQKTSAKVLLLLVPSGSGVYHSGTLLVPACSQALW